MEGQIAYVLKSYTVHKRRWLNLKYDLILVLLLLFDYCLVLSRYSWVFTPSWMALVSYFQERQSKNIMICFTVVFAKTFDGSLSLRHTGHYFCLVICCRVKEWSAQMKVARYIDNHFRWLLYCLTDRLYCAVYLYIILKRLCYRVLTSFIVLRIPNERQDFCF